MASERTPLINDSDSESQVSTSKIPRRLQPATPLPKKQILILCVMRFSEPISFNLIFPFINEMIASVGISNPGYSSGLIEGTFAFAQLLTVYQWGALSDRIGRKPVLLMGLSGAVVFTCLFGLSTSFIMILLSRFFIGLSNGNIAVLKSAIAELTDETNQGRAFSFLPLSWSVGSIVAPIIGGYLARPAEQYPNVFGSSALFIKYPYLLPCLAGASITVIGWLAGFFFFEESLGGRKPAAKKIPSTPEERQSLITEQPSTSDIGSTTTLVVPPSPPLSVRGIVTDAIIRRVLVSYIFLALVTVSVDAILVLWLYMPLEKGGVGFTTSQTGIVLSCIGILATFLNLVIFPPVQRRLGTVPVYRFGVACQPIIITMFPITRYITLLEGHAGDSLTGQLGVWTKVAMAVLVVAKAAGGMVFAANMILVSSSAPSRTSLGAVNGVAQMVASSMRALGPTFATILFAVSTDARYHALGGQLVWVYLIVLSGCGVFASMQVQEGRGESTE